MSDASYGGINSWKQDCQRVGYEIYSQNVEVHCNPFTRRDLDFIPLRSSYFRRYTGCPAAVHRQFENHDCTMYILSLIKEK